MVIALPPPDTPLANAFPGVTPRDERDDCKPQLLVCKLFSRTKSGS
jgi:hypothetical protein